MKWLNAILLIAALGYAATGIYTVGTDQRAVVRRFGRVIGEISEPGLHVGLPWGLDRVDLVKPGETKTVEIGRTGDPLGTTAADTLAQFLTGDQNLVNVQATVQYTIRDPKQYLFASAEPERLVARAAEAAITQTLADRSIDEVITTGKSVLAERVRDELQARLNRDYQVGVEVRSVSLLELSPPSQVAEAFTRAASARSDRERLILEARSYANEKRAEAQSEARATLDRATADHDRAINLARSEADRFAKLLSEYHKDEALTATRLYLETMAEIIPQFRSKVIVDSGKEVDVTIMRDEP